MELNLCAGYCRCSTDMQDRSISDQMKEIEEFSRKNNLKIIRWFLDEARSGTSIVYREGFQEMKNLVDAGKNDFSTILIYDTSRWGRFPDPRESIYWEVHFEKKGVEIIYTNDDVQNTKSFHSAILKTIKHAAAGDFSRRLSVLVTRACISLAREGFWLGGPAPYGYRRAEVDKSKRVVRMLGCGKKRCNPEHRLILVMGDHEEVDTVKRIFDYFVNRNVDLKTIARMLNNEGIPGPNDRLTETNGAEATTNSIKQVKSRWTYDNLFRLVNKQIYTGKMVFGVKKRGIFSRSENLWGDRTGRKNLHDRQNIIVCNGAHPPIISEEIFNRAQDIIHRREKTRRCKRARLSSPYLLSGIIECSQCGFPFYGGYYGCKWYRNKDRYRYYRDEGHSSRKGKICSTHYIKARLVDYFVLDKIQRRLAYYDSTKRIIRLLTHALDRVDGLKSSALLLHKGIRENEEKTREIKLYLKNHLTHKMTDDPAIESTCYQLSSNNYNHNVKVKQRLVRFLPKVAQDVKDYYSFCSGILSTSTLEEKKVILRNILKKIVIDMRKSVVTLHFYLVPRNINFYLDFLSLGVEVILSKTSLPKRETLMKLRKESRRRRPNLCS